MECLLFTLYAPLASWGDIAVGEYRGSWHRPSRSAVLGLLGAALGLRRDESAAHEALATGYGLAVRLDAVGTALSDYQTAQTAAESELRRRYGGRRPRTRSEVLAVSNRETVVSRRMLRQDALATAAIWVQAQLPRWTLAQLAHALRYPAFVLYAGRKANVLGLPLRPQCAQASTLAEAFAVRPPLHPRIPLSGLRGHTRWGNEVAYDTLPPGIPSGLESLREEVRRDAFPERQRWQFRDRIVHLGRLPETDK